MKVVNVEIAARLWQAPGTFCFESPLAILGPVHIDTTFAANYGMMMPMNKTDTLIHTKLRLPFIRPELVPRPRLQAQIAQGLRGPLTLIAAPAGFGKTTLAASGVAGCGSPVAWLSLDKHDNQVGRFLNYLVAALQGADRRIGGDAALLLAGMQPAPAEAVLTSLVNDLDAAAGELVLVLDDYQFISSQAVHSAVAFLLDHCPDSFPPGDRHPLRPAPAPGPPARARPIGRASCRRLALYGRRGNAVPERRDGPRPGGRIGAVLEERTEGWIAGLQMAALAVQAHACRTGTGGPGWLDPRLCGHPSLHHGLSAGGGAGARAARGPGLSPPDRDPEPAHAGRSATR